MTRLRFLKRCAAKGDLAALREWLEKAMKQGAVRTVNDTDERGETVIWRAFTKEVAEYLLKEGADLNIKNCEGQTLMMELSLPECQLDLVELYLKYGVDLTITDSDGTSVYEWLISQISYVPKAKYLLPILEKEYKKQLRMKLTELSMNLASLNLPVLQVLAIASNLIDLSLVPETVQWEIVKCVKHFND